MEELNFIGPTTRDDTGNHDNLKKRLILLSKTKQ